MAAEAVAVVRHHLSIFLNVLLSVRLRLVSAVVVEVALFSAAVLLRQTEKLLVNIEVTVGVLRTRVLWRLKNRESL